KVSIAKRDIQDVEERRITNCGNWMNERTSTVISKHLVQSDETGAASGNVPVSVSIRDGNYSFDIHMPPVRGKTVLKGRNSQKGYCDPKLDDEQITSPVENPKQFDALRFRIEGKIDPQKPNVLSGTLKFDPNITINWHLTRASGDCDDGELSVEGLTLKQHVFPNATAWQEIGENTVDGNQVKITATVSNSSKKSKSGTVTVKETTSGEVLGTQSVSVAGGGSADVEILWDTNGYSWSDAGGGLPDRRIEASLSNGSNAEAEVKVSPKPVIMVHGLWSNGAAWSDYHNYLREAYDGDWKGYAVGANPKVAEMHTGDSAGNWDATYSIRQNAQELGKQILHTQKTENAWRIDVVAHSMGGLISRYYIHNTMTNAPDGKPTIAHLVMLGTPNMGSPCADLMYPTYKSLGFEVEALRQLRPSVVAEFNSQTTNRKGVKFSILAGIPLPNTCQSQMVGDGVVEVPSALWQVADRGYAPRIHTAITGREDFFAFVKPRLALGPKRAKQTAGIEKKSNDESFAKNFSSIGEYLIASVNPLAILSNLQTASDTVQVVLSKNVKIAVGERAEIPVNLETAKTGVTFVVAPFVKVSLVNAGNGETEQTIEAGSTEAAQAFKTFYAENPGNKILRFENTGELPANAVAAIWTDKNPLALEFVEIHEQVDGTVKMQAMLTNNGTAIKGAVVSVKINNKLTEIVLADDGKHGDGAAGDGIYGATTEKLTLGEHFIEARANSNGSQATVTTLLTIREANK
ncbi:MAG TPA: choice-of-anchor X domain-containing protein, partial [Pyrinomonadaceae bacterium]|nr:choice-of-anchor X domain-containing protein [Pyrinomonadaceae bacterium]